MPLTKQKGNMYDFISHCWNPIYGKCSHDCHYCYVKSMPFQLKPLAFRSTEVNEIKLGKGKTIFIGSATDMFAEDVPAAWIKDVLKKCNEYPDNTYFFQSKNTFRFRGFCEYFPKDAILGTTIETNRKYENCRAPNVYVRANYLGALDDYSRTVTIEPIMDFDLESMVDLIFMASPKFVSIGADSKGHNLPEPSAEKIKSLIEELSKFTRIREKYNLARLLKN